MEIGKTVIITTGTYRGQPGQVVGGWFPVWFVKRRNGTIGWYYERELK